MNFYVVATFLLLTPHIWTAPLNNGGTVVNEEPLKDSSFQGRARVIRAEPRTTTKHWLFTKTNPEEPRFIHFGR
ncbi:hypothetical protein Y032_0193g1396 [Ancylostoma ceylanicum]|uniref:Secreted protein n=1 Tax=Ancylostoma ceylanicum TaxID=53326 RepID=A0A016SPG4_9BILA|nr:hypothetical protein Y032_0193g1396 [Ancylostoma ceylanicum]